MRAQVIFYFFLFLLLNTNAYSLYAGVPTTVFSINDCISYAKVNVVGNLTIDENEYKLLGDCDEINKNEWFCACDGHLDIDILTNLTTINTYKFYIEWLSETAPQQPIIKIVERSGGGGGSLSFGATPYWLKDNKVVEVIVEVPVEKEVIIEKEIVKEITIEKEIPAEKDIIVEKEIIKNNNTTKNTIVISSLLIIILLLIFGMLYLHNKTKKKEQEQEKDIDFDIEEL